MLMYAQVVSASWVITSFIYHASAGAGKRCRASRCVTFSAECGVQTVMNAGLIVMMMLWASAFADPDAAHGAKLAAVANLLPTLKRCWDAPRS
jgi:hypothetical protein